MQKQKSLLLKIITIYKSYNLYLNRIQTDELKFKFDILIRIIIRIK